jgi:hypothetical protein
LKKPRIVGRKAVRKPKSIAETKTGLKSPAGLNVTRDPKMKAMK